MTSLKLVAPIFRSAIITTMFIVLLASCTAAATPTTTPPPDGVTILDFDKPQPDFTLSNQLGQPFHLTDLKGKLTLLTFGYTHCPDVCPTTLANFKQVKQALGNDAAQVNFVFISVDGTRDTPQVLMNYLKQFDPAFIGLTTGDDSTMQKIVKDFGAAYYIDARTPDTAHANATPSDYTVTHTASWFVLDGTSHLRRKYAYEIRPEVAAADMQQVLTKH